MAAVFIRRHQGACEGKMSSAPNDDIMTLGGGGDAEFSLLDILDHVLNAGVVVHGSVVISLGGVDLVYLGLNAVLTSVETALKHIKDPTILR
jgi:hypothetical protein